jgi:hypothetical protein
MRSHFQVVGFYWSCFDRVSSREHTANGRGKRRKETGNKCSYKAFMTGVSLL